MIRAQSPKLAVPGLDSEQGKRGTEQNQSPGSLTYCSPVPVNVLLIKTHTHTQKNWCTGATITHCRILLKNIFIFNLEQ